MNCKSHIESKPSKTPRENIFHKLFCKLALYQDLGPNDKKLLELAEKEIDNLLGIASDWICADMMSSILTRCSYPRNIKEEIQEMNLSKETLFLCLSSDSKDLE